MEMSGPPMPKSPTATNSVAASNATARSPPDAAMTRTARNSGPLEADAVDEGPAGRGGDDVDQGPGAQDGAHCGVAEAEIAADGVDQRRHRHRQQAESEIDQPHPAQHGPAIAMLVGRYGRQRVCGPHALTRAATVQCFAPFKARGRPTRPRRASRLRGSVRRRDPQPRNQVSDHAMQDDVAGCPNMTFS